MSKKTTRPKAPGKTAPSVSAARSFVFEFFEIRDNKTKCKTDIAVEAAGEAEAWEKLKTVLDKDRRELVYSGNFYIKQ